MKYTNLCNKLEKECRMEWKEVKAGQEDESTEDTKVSHVHCFGELLLGADPGFLTPADKSGVQEPGVYAIPPSMTCNISSKVVYGIDYSLA